MSLVSKALKGACEEAQLSETEVTVSSQCLANFQSYLPWFKRSTAQLKALNIDCSLPTVSFLGPSENTKLAALLEVVSAREGGLQHLTLTQPREGWQQALSGLVELQSLHINAWYAAWHFIRAMRPSQDL